MTMTTSETATAASGIPAAKQHCFWEEIHRRGVASISIQRDKLIAWLAAAGFGKIAEPGSEMVRLLRVKGNLVEETAEWQVQDFVLAYVRSLDVNLRHCATCTRHDLENALLSGVGHYFSTPFLRSLPTLHLHPLRDGPSHAWLFYRNTAVRVTPEGMEMTRYADLDGHVWKSRIHDRDFRYEPAFGNEYQCDIAQFMYAVCRRHGADGIPDEAATGKAYRSLYTLMGYLLHGYKDPASPRAVVLMDESVDENPQGGTGKGLLLKCISHLRKTVKYDGPNFDLDKNFIWQRIGADTQVVGIEDASRRLDFDRLFSVLTEGMVVERKNKGEFFIPYEDSPKFVLTTNFALAGLGASHERRRYEFLLAGTFGSRYTPQDLLGRNMFHDWDEDEWKRFDNFAAHMVQMYLHEGVAAPESPVMADKKLLSATSAEFAAFCRANIPHGEEHSRGKLHADFLAVSGETEKACSAKRFIGWLRLWASLNSLSVREGQSHDGARWIRFDPEPKKA